MSHQPTSIVVGSGPNGLAAAIYLAQRGHRVTLYEAADQPGGGLRSAPLTLPGYQHDVCAAVLPLAQVSPFFRTLALDTYGVKWVTPPAALAHPFDDRPATLLYSSLAQTAAGLGPDAQAYRSLLTPLIRHAAGLWKDILGPLRWPQHPLALAQFGLSALRSAVGLSRAKFRSASGQALLAGLSAHSMLDLKAPISAAVGLVLALAAHQTGWPIVQGGSFKVAAALTQILNDHGGTIITGREIATLGDLPEADNILLDSTPKQFLAMAEGALPDGYRKRLSGYRYGPGVCKVDWALDEPIPWIDPSCRMAGTVHLGGTMEEIANAEHAVWSGQHADHPFVILVQPTLFDPSRSPQEMHIAWAYCHVPHASQDDRHQAIETQIERFAPGFRKRILSRHVRTAFQYESYNPNIVGGDINGGVQDWRQLYARPTLHWNPYRTPIKNVYLCSSSSPPGGGVHGMCGYHAARSIEP
ncbi:MAG: NAD(P)/FAD-dependent oxidoreductase [Anaerolineales bacterium]|jgi:phytoene dehydrogenase-like protein